jgi:type IV secretory pathway component VirB8
MSPTPVLAPVTVDPRAARSQFLDLYGRTLVMNTYFKILLLCLSLVLIGLVGVVFKATARMHDRERTIVGIDSIGRARVLDSKTLEYHPHEAEIKYFLTLFVHDHYARMRATMKEDYDRSLYFLDAPLANSLIESNKNSKDIESFLAGQGEENENDVKVTGVSIEDLRQPPYHATIAFEKIFYAPGHQESRREKYIAHFLFVARDRIPNNLIPVNPLGLTITYFREDQSFQ